MSKSSINLKLSSLFALMHNLRKALITYTIADPGRNTSDKNYEEAVKLYLEMLDEAVSNYYERTRQRIQTDQKKYIWEAVANLNEHHTIEDVKNLSAALSKKYSWQVIHCSVHKDEGHVDLKSGEKIFNFHAHILFFMLDTSGFIGLKRETLG